MNEKIWEKLQKVSGILHWLGKHDEARVINAFQVWLQLNGTGETGDAVELLEMTNDNPNLESNAEGVY